MSLGIDPQGAADPKLPLWDTICLSYSTYFYNFRNVLRICWLWLAVAALLTGIANWLQFSWMAEVMVEMIRGVPPQIQTYLASRPLETIMLGYAAGLVLFLAGLSIAVAWHRRIILDEHPGFSGSNVATKDLWRYVGTALAIGLIVVLPWLVVIVPMFLLSAPVAAGGAPGFAMLMPVIFLFSLAAVMLRLSLLLPARAVGDLGLTFKEAWKRTRGNTWRMFWGIAACTVPPMLAAQIVLLGLLSPGMFDEAFVDRMTIITTIFNMY